MTNTQKIIKWTALAFAGLIILSIINFIVFLFFNVFYYFGADKEVKYSTYENNNFDSLSIETNSIINIKQGSTFKIETNNDFINIIEEGRTLKIEEKTHFNYWFAKDLFIDVYIPENFKFREVDIENGAGLLTIDSLNTGVLDLELGAGLSDLKNINATGSAQIDIGAGKLNLKNSTFNNLDLSVGAGSCEADSIKIYGNNDFEIGMGKLSATLDQSAEEFNFDVEKGIGAMTIDNKEITKNAIYGNGKNRLSIENGVGSSTINFLK